MEALCSYFSTISSLQAAMRSPEVGGALVQTHSRTPARTHARASLNRFLRILNLKVEKKDLMIVVGIVEDEEEGGTGTEDEEEEGKDTETEGGQVVRRMAL